jgi:hypothetical protein
MTQTFSCVAYCHASFQDSKLSGVNFAPTTQAGAGMA